MADSDVLPVRTVLVEEGVELAARSGVACDRQSGEAGPSARKARSITAAGQASRLAGSDGLGRLHAINGRTAQAA